MRNALIPAGHSKPVGRYSPGIAVQGGSLVFVSGQVATDESGAVLEPGDVAGQTRVVFDRMGQVLKAAGGTLADLVSLVIYVVDVRRDFAAVSGVRNGLLSEPAPASTLVEVAALVEDGCLVEISGVAVVHSGTDGRR
jgi:enamine deaminase RidA (YjgF/YER057c/UK114 family)